MDLPRQSVKDSYGSKRNDDVKNSVEFSRKKNEEKGSIMVGKNVMGNSGNTPRMPSTGIAESEDDDEEREIIQCRCRRRR